MRLKIWQWSCNGGDCLVQFLNHTHLVRSLCLYYKDSLGGGSRETTYTIIVCSSSCVVRVFFMATKTDVSLKDLLEAGCHFGHQARRWNPHMKPYLYAKRDGIHIFDLVKTKEGLDEACKVLRQAAKSGKKIVFLATKRQAQPLVKEAAVKAGVPFITERWLGGMLTNYAQIKKNIQKLKDLKKKKETNNLDEYTKKERLLIDREINKLDRFLGGIAQMDGKPDVMFVVDTHREKVAIDEARQSGVTIVGMVDSNGEPNGIDVVIPANDDAVKSIQLIVSAIAASVSEGMAERPAAAVAK